MASRSRRNVPPKSDQAAERRRGGQELPDDAQDRPEQNKGYDEAVAEGPPIQPHGSARFLDIDLVDLEREGPRAGRRDGDQADAPVRDVPPDVDDLAERDAISDVRRRERRS